MNDANFRERLFEILKDTDSLPRQDYDRIVHLARKSSESHEKLQQKLANLQQSLDYLRLGVKYLIFDLEATRRENVDLRKRLEKNPPRDNFGE
ncbi:MAG: hypothetical protein LLF76_14095 [Planctomycetaceae bacterium]|nr:hypothetical protein [Planctomycetaceae bacterium]